MSMGALEVRQDARQQAYDYTISNLWTTAVLPTTDALIAMSMATACDQLDLFLDPTTQVYTDLDRELLATAAYHLFVTLGRVANEGEVYRMNTEQRSFTVKQVFFHAAELLRATTEHTPNRFIPEQHIGLSGLVAMVNSFRG